MKPKKLPKSVQLPSGPVFDQGSLSCSVACAMVAAVQMTAKAQNDDFTPSPRMLYSVSRVIDRDALVAELADAPDSNPGVPRT